ncbi:MAG: nicotinate-nucleotide adenylyltransferase [Coriobacteriia bacterium]|nr:nicotinate-nucleotide adenylyltransferase [Coriobacteriia bacterium]
MPAERIGILGGTFDPPHIGHLVCAQEALVQLDLDRVIFMVCGKPALKDSSAIATAEDRYWMTCLAVADNPAFEVSRIEVDRIGTSYTVDTLRELRQQIDDGDEVFFIMGADALREVPQWKDARRVGEYATFVVATRPGTDVRAARATVLDRLPNFSFDLIILPNLEVASSDIRERVRNGQSIHYLVSEEVEHYVQQRELY